VNRLPRPFGAALFDDLVETFDLDPDRMEFMFRRLGGACFVVAAALAVSTMLTSTSRSEDQGKKTLTREEARKLRSPVPFSKASIARGKILFRRACTECHGADGKSLVDVVANATDLTNPKAWKSGTTEGEVFHSIRDGAGEAMPPFAEKYSKEQDLWDLVNYLRSLWPDADRPKLKESAAR
jgi:mono/diheme cytochrome c family protein